MIPNDIIHFVLFNWNMSEDQQCDLKAVVVIVVIVVAVVVVFDVHFRC